MECADINSCVFLQANIKQTTFNEFTQSKYQSEIFHRASNVYFEMNATDENTYQSKTIPINSYITTGITIKLYEINSEQTIYIQQPTLDWTLHQCMSWMKQQMSEYDKEKYTTKKDSVKFWKVHQLQKTHLDRDTSYSQQIFKTITQYEYIKKLLADEKVMNYYIARRRVLRSSKSLDIIISDLERCHTVLNKP